MIQKSTKTILWKETIHVSNSMKDTKNELSQKIRETDSGRKA